MLFFTTTFDIDTVCILVKHNNRLFISYQSLWKILEQSESKTAKIQRNVNKGFLARGVR